MSENRKLKVGTVVKFEDDDFEETANLYLLGSSTMAYLNYVGAVSSTSRPENDEKVTPVVVVDDEDEFIKKILQSVPMDHSWRGKIQSAVAGVLREMRESYYEPSLAEKMYNESPHRASTWPAWEKLDEAEAAGWKKAAETKEAYDKLLEQAGMKMMDISPSVKGPDYNVGGVVKRRPIKDTPQA